MRVEQDRLQLYLKKIHGTPCPLCGSNHWDLSDTVFYVSEFDPKTIRLGGNMFPIIPLTCRNCGNTYLINALVAKLIDPNVASEENVKKDSGDSNV